MERRVDVATGEGVAFSYELAGLGSRFLAVLIDLALQLVAAGLIGALLVWAASALPAGVRLPVAAQSRKTVRALLYAGLIVALFLLFFGYFIIFEWRWNGRTPGKRLLGIRVVRDGGFPLDFASSVVRNVVRILEFGLGFYAIAAISALISPLNQRLGDLAAGTIVVRDSPYERLGQTTPSADGEPTDPIVHELSAGERDLIRRYADRRAALVAPARERLAAQLADRIRPKLPASYDHLDDDALLLHVASFLGYLPPNLRPS
ncbi:MAG: RDD family protein [Vulcanimicrobiaceae bacterium]